MRKLLVLTAICLAVIVSANGAMAQSYVQNDRLTCGCDNPTTPADECIVIIGSPGDVCPTNAAHFVQNDQATCGCDNPTTVADECNPPPANCAGTCLAQFGDDSTVAYRNCVRSCEGCTNLGGGIYSCTSCDSGGACCQDSMLNPVACPAGSELPVDCNWNVPNSQMQCNPSGACFAAIDNGDGTYNKGAQEICY